MRLTFIMLQFVIKIFVSSIFEWPLKTGVTVHKKHTIWASTQEYLSLWFPTKRDSDQSPPIQRPARIGHFHFKLEK